MNHLSAGVAAARPRLVHTNIAGQAESLLFLFLCISARMHSIGLRTAGLLWETGFHTIYSSNQRMHDITYTLHDVIMWYITPLEYCVRWWPEIISGTPCLFRCCLLSVRYIKILNKLFLKTHSHVWGSELSIIMKAVTNYEWSSGCIP